MISHSGKIVKIENKEIIVSIKRNDMCKHCQLKGECHIFSGQEQIIRITAPKNQKFSVGETIEITTSSPNIWKALFFCYIIPLILLVGSVVQGHYTKLSENKTALITFGSLGIYYIILGISQKFITKKIKFEIFNN